MFQNSSVPSTPSSTASSGKPTVVTDPSNTINGLKQHANKVCRCACVCQEVCRSDDYYCDPCIAAKHNCLPPGLDKHVVAMKNPGAKDILVSLILVFIATILVIARLNLRLQIQKRKLLLSDIFMVAAWISGVITAAFSPVFAVLKAFDPSVHTTLEGYDGGSANLVLILKAALLAVYLQVFPEFMVKRRRFLWVTIWDLNPSKTCPKWTYAVTFHVGWGLSFLGDLLVFILPWLIVPALHVRRTLRFGIYFTFLLGTVNMAVSLVRFVMIWKAGADSSISLSTIVLWSALDVNIGLVVACLPSLRPYFGARTKSQEHSRESNSWDSSGKHSGFGNRTVCFHSKQRDSEAWPTSSGHARYSSIDPTVVGSWDDMKELKDPNDVELRVLPGARIRDVKYGR
ncbi:integral membrane protein [Fusarium mundagurra]|uniref:Integral membrane protein n=1 Tax=Fusarium mundagurra TaxID=1567541 RepID=A0A8H5Z8Y6_9HYPO|nr:integral membrane protein [Fusarium mundagurra]